MYLCVSRPLLLSCRYTRTNTVRLDCSEGRKELLYGAEDVLIALANGDARSGTLHVPPLHAAPYRYITVT